MRSEIRTALAALVTTAVVLGSATMALAGEDDGDVTDPAATSTTTTPPTDAPTTAEPTTAEPTTAEPTEPAPTEKFSVSNAQLRWGFNNESNNRAFAPGTFNFFSAGKIANPGRGGVVLKEKGWKKSSGTVRIEKYSSSSKKWSLASWAGLKTDSSGVTMSGTNGPFSNHEVVISGGKGSVDPADRSASIQWTGSFTVLYYSGYSFFYVTDPRLTVKNGTGTVTATLSGYGSSMEDLEKWESIAPVKNVVIANLGAVDLSDDLGFDVTPKYRGVSVDVPSGQTQQVRSGEAWGSFPQSFINYQVASGSGSYWYSSGGSADAHKTTLPLTVSYAADKPVETDDPDTTGGGSPTVDNDALTPPGPGALLPPSAVAAGAPGAGDVTAGGAFTQVQPLSTVIGASATRDDGTSPAPVWILGGALLGFALLVSISPFAYSAIRRTA